MKDHMDHPKDVSTLVDDIYAVFTKPHKVSQENLNELGEAIKECVRLKIEEAGTPRVPTLRMSVIGKPDRQLWYELNSKDTSKVAEFGDVDVLEPNPEKYLKFLFGDIIEQLLVFLIKESGHEIKFRQEEVEIDGVLGHTDGVIDRVPADIKSASNFQFQSKFKSKALLSRKPENDPFGYKGQLSGYRDRMIENHPDEVDTDRAGWFTMNKESGELCWLEIDPLDLIDAPARVKHLKEMVAKPTPPEKKCFPEVPDGKSGNMMIHKSCSYCPFKFDCFKDANDGQGLRTFKYSTGWKFFTKIVKEPRVEEA